MGIVDLAQHMELQHTELNEKLNAIIELLKNAPTSSGPVSTARTAKTPEELAALDAAG